MAVSRETSWAAKTDDHWAVLTAVQKVGRWATHWAANWVVQKESLMAGYWVGVKVEHWAIH